MKKGIAMQLLLRKENRHPNLHSHINHLSWIGNGVSDQNFNLLLWLTNWCTRHFEILNQCKYVKYFFWYLCGIIFAVVHLTKVFFFHLRSIFIDLQWFYVNLRIKNSRAIYQGKFCSHHQRIENSNMTKTKTFTDWPVKSLDAYQDAILELITGSCKASLIVLEPVLKVKHNTDQNV